MRLLKHLLTTPSYRHIAVSFQEAYASLKSRVADATGDQQATIGEKIARWRFEPPDPMTTYPEYPKDIEKDLEADVDDNFDVEKELPDLAEAVVFLFQSDAFEQLQTRMRTESLLSDRDGQAIQSIRTTILGALDTPDSRSQGLKLRTAKFSVSWNPVEFLRQQYPEVERPAIKDIITLTGAATDAQAVTCELYIRQLWPLSGEDALLVLQMAVDNPGWAYERKITFLPP